ncbi:Fic family protein [Patulibacter sp. S7RM1-6]
MRWTPDPDAHGPRRARRPVVIEAYVPAPLDRLDLRLTTDAATAVADAEREVAAAQAHADVVGPTALAAQLLRSEAIASSQMEGVAVPSNRTLAKVAVSGRHHENARAALEAVAAVGDAYAWAVAGDEPFAPDVLLRLHAAIARSDRRLAAHAGRFRERQNWIGPDAHTPRGAEFVPPPPDRLPRLIADLVGYLERADLPPVVQAAAAHAQFETIHPFPDGNGRVGRMLIGMTLARGGLAREVVPPVSLVLSRERERYVEALTRWRFAADGTEAWVVLLARALEEAALATKRLADAIVALQDEWRTMASVRRRDSSADRLLSALVSSPVIDAKAAQVVTGRSRSAAERALRRLEDDGVLRQVTLGRRNRAWESVGLFALLDDFERGLSGGTVGVGETR